MKIASLLCVAAPVVNAYHYVASTSTNAPGYSQNYVASTSTNAPGYSQNYVTPTKATVAPTKAPIGYKSDAKEHFNLFWDNLELCDAEYDLSSCLLHCSNSTTFFEEKRIAQCYVKFVRGFCGKLTAEHKHCDTGKIKIDSGNCPTAAFADAFLVFNKMASKFVGNDPFNSIKVAVSATVSNADCVISSFFKFLDQCAVSSYISSHDMQCVEQYLNSTDNSCEFAEEDGDDWDFPRMIKLYGWDGAKDVVNKLKKKQGTTRDQDILPALQKVMKSIASDSAHGTHFVSTEYDLVNMETSVEVCPTSYKSMNSLFTDTGAKGIPVSDVAFHFPVNASATNANVTVDVDPITDKSIYKTCKAYFGETMKSYNSTGVDDGDRCFSINEYNLHFIESRTNESLSYNETNNFSGQSPCYTASWNEPRSCSSHLTEWQMSVACCKSFHSVTKQYGSVTTSHGFQLLEQGHYSYNKNAPKIVKIDEKDLVFDLVVLSNSTHGSLSRVDKKAAVSSAALLEEHSSTKVEYKAHNPFYIGDSIISKLASDTLEIGLNFSSIVPLVTGKCYPQACILSQLASCMEIPDKKYESYDYVAGSKATGYNYYQALLSAKVGGSNVAALASIGFVAGVAVVAIAQAVLARRRSSKGIQQLV